MRATSESGCEGGTQGLRAATGGGLLCPPLRKKRKPSYDSPGDMSASRQPSCLVEARREEAGTGRTAQRVGRHVGEHSGRHAASEPAEPMPRVDDLERVAEPTSVADRRVVRQAARLEERLAHVERGRDGCRDCTGDAACRDVSDGRVGVRGVDLVPVGARLGSASEPAQRTGRAAGGAHLMNS